MRHETFMDLNDRTILSYNQIFLSSIRIKSFKQVRVTLITVQPNNISKTHIAIHFDLLHFWPSVRSFIFTVFLKCSLKAVIFIFTEFYGHFPCFNLAKIRDTTPLKHHRHL